MDDANRPPTNPPQLENVGGNESPPLVSELRALLPKGRVARVEYRRKKKAARRKLDRQLSAKQRVERQAEACSTKGFCFPGSDGRRCGALPEPFLLIGSLQIGLSLCVDRLNPFVWPFEALTEYGIGQLAEYQERELEIERCAISLAWVQRLIALLRDYRLRKQQWEAKEAMYALERARRNHVEAVLKAQLEASLGKASGIEAGPEVQSSLGKDSREDISSNCPTEPSCNPTDAKVSPEPSEGGLPCLSQEPCIMFEKTGSCRLGPSCKWNHLDVFQPTPILLFPHMFTFLGGEAQDSVGSVQVLTAFNEFFDDLFPELNRFGGVQDVKVTIVAPPPPVAGLDAYPFSRGEVQRRLYGVHVARQLKLRPHLRGNVYVAYASSDLASKVHRRLKDRFYGGRTLLPRYLNQTTLRPILCGAFEKFRNCGRGSKCNYVHAFISPNFKTPYYLRLSSNPPQPDPVGSAGS
ncbi:U2 small nuclear ribonucleoprotein auxiliary factor 35 kDa subunit- protein 2 [Massospora cicadina]|nr:U2 small nuclear ribonucleoprotein auxiliary factor 35 kDa subunit- protein 2 [Massospora cicadina]